jgi:ribosomal protein S12 methylthiotransferase
LKTKSHNNKINVITLGCSKNIYDSEVLLGQLKASNIDAGHEETNYDANVVIINTCGFIENAKQESINTILHWVKLKQEGIIEKVYVTGCLSQRYKQDLEKEIPDVDKYFGTRDLPLLLKTLGADYKHELIGERVITTPLHYAYLKISEGCNRPCSFCAIPLMRGKHTSIPIENLINQSKNLAKKGVKELILIAQDLTYYGLDIYKKRALADLLNKLCEIDGIEWIRLHYAFPQGFPTNVLYEIKNQDKICNYIDIPLQHINDNILNSMRRGITKNKTINLINKIRDTIPEIAIRTTIITGYPGETETEFEELKQCIVETKFERLGVFTYSHEENTFAFNLKDSISPKLKQQRADELMKIQQKISFENNKKFIGKELKVIVDFKENNYYVGRTEFDSPEVDNQVLIYQNQTSYLKNNNNINSNFYLRIGDFINVSIIDAKQYDLIAAIK